MPRTYWRIKKTPNALNNAAGKMMAAWVSIQLQPPEDEVQRDDGQLERHHHRGQEDREQGVVPREPDPGERVGRHRAGQQREDRDQSRDVEAVEVRAWRTARPPTPYGTRPASSCSAAASADA